MTSVVYETGSAGFERRIGKRVPADGIPVTWVETAWGEGAQPRKAREWPGRVVEVSVTGAAVEGPSDLAVGPGTKAVLRYRGEDSGVVVRRVTETADPDVLRYAVELAVVSPGLKAAVYEAVSGGEDPRRWEFTTS
jgi:hypothetical protein